MSEVGNKININVGDVLKKGSNELGMDELNKMGLKKVKVIRHSQVQELISQAVDNAISKFIFGAEGRKEHERLMSLITEKESALSDVSGAERTELKGEVETLKKQMQEQSKRLEEAKAKVIEETKKEYEALAEKTSLENQLILQKRSEEALQLQLQETSALVEPLKEKLEAEKQKNQMAARAISEKLKQSEELNGKLSRAEEEKRKLEAEFSSAKDMIREKEFALRESQSKFERLQQENDEKIKIVQKSSTGLDSELKKISSEKESAFLKNAQLEAQLNLLKDADKEAKALSEKFQIKEEAFREKTEGLKNNLVVVMAERDKALSLLENIEKQKSADDLPTKMARLDEEKKKIESNFLGLKDQLREKEFSVRETQMKLEHLQSEKEQSRHHSTQLESQIYSLKESVQEAKSVSDKLAIKEEAAREKAESLKNNLLVATNEKEKTVALLTSAEKEIEVLQNTVNSMQLAQKATENQKAEMIESFKAMMTDMQGSISDEIKKARLRGGNGGGGGGNNNDSFVELDPSVILKNMFAEKVESNFGKVELGTGRAAGKKDFGKTLDALKNLNKKEE